MREGWKKLDRKEGIGREEGWKEERKDVEKEKKRRI